MLINSVSFRADDPFKDLVNKPQAYTSQPAAASGVKGDEFKKSHKGAKVVAGLAGLAAVAVGALAYVSKKPDLVNKIKDLKFLQNNETLRNVAKSAKNIGTVIADKAVNLFNSAKAMLPKKAAEVAEQAVETVA